MGGLLWRKAQVMGVSNWGRGSKGPIELVVREGSQGRGGISGRSGG